MPWIVFPYHIIVSTVITFFKFNMMLTKVLIFQSLNVADISSQDAHRAHCGKGWGCLF